MPIEKEEEFSPTDFSKMNRGIKSLADAIFRLGDWQKSSTRPISKEDVLRSLWQCDYDRMREISNLFYKVSGIYQRLCRYMAYMYRYDWLVTPYYSANEEAASEDKKDKVLSGFNAVLAYLDNFEIKRFFG